MEKLIGNYETIFVVDPTQGEEAVAAVIEKFKALISEHGTIESVDDWGKRRLAYPINDLTEGHYVLVNFSSEHAFPAELDRIYKINDSILRSIIVAK